MKLLKEINTLLSEYYGENIAINIDGSRMSTTCDRDRGNSNINHANIDNLTIDKSTNVTEAMGFHVNSVLIGIDQQNLLADRGFSIFQDTTYFNVDPEMIFLVN